MTFQLLTCDDLSHILNTHKAHLLSVLSNIGHGRLWWQIFWELPWPICKGWWRPDVLWQIWKL